MVAIIQDFQSTGSQGAICNGNYRDIDNRRVLLRMGRIEYLNTKPYVMGEGNKL